MPIEIKQLTQNVDRDSRGFEIQGMQKSKLFDGMDLRDIVLQTIRPHKIRGNHYHIKKTEWFFPIRGSAILSWSDINGAEIQLHTILMSTDFQNPKMYKILPKTCHVVENKTEEDFYMLAFSSEDFDQSDNPRCNLFGEGI